MILIFDMDGVIYRGHELLPGVRETLELLEREGHKVHYMTNNSTQTRESYRQKLAGMGITADVGHIMTSSYATALFLKEKHAIGRSVLAVGEPGLVEELTEIGMKVVEEPPADYVVVGLDRGFTYKKLLNAQQAIYHGARFIATNRDATFPLENDRIIPGGGAIVAAVQEATGIKPAVMGKPETYALKKILDMESGTPEDAVLIGDRLDTDVQAGKNLGSKTVLMLTGITSAEQAAKAPEELKPDVILSDLSELPEVLRSLES